MYELLTLQTVLMSENMDNIDKAEPLPISME